MCAVKVVIISGRSGVGKSTVTYEVCHRLRQREYAHVHIDGDNLHAAYPRPDSSELMLANLKAIWANFAAIKGDHVLILSGTGLVLEHVGIRTAIEEVSLPPVHISAVILTASDAIAERRLKQREIGTDLEAHLQSSMRMGKVLADFDGVPVCKISTDNRSVADIAGEIVKVILEPSYT